MLYTYISQYIKGDVKMEKGIIFRASEELYDNLNWISKEMDRPKSFVIRKALELFINEYVDYLIALDRLRDKDDSIITSKEMRRRVAKG
jgi:RHH-type rel operon transcriptional repressor/antitoxin RelB